MYKALVNNQIVNMRKEVKKSQRHVIQTIHKQLKSNQNLLDKAKEKENEKLVMKFNQRGEKLAEDIRVAKGIKPDEVSKMALIAKDYPKEFETREQRIKTMIAKHSYVQKMVTAFRNENQDWESWIETIIELWHEKKEIRSGGKTKEKDKKKETMPSLKPTKKNIDCNGDSHESKARESKNDPEDGDNDLNNDNESDNLDNEPEEEKVEEEVDDFFLGSKIKQKIIKRTLNEEDGNEETFSDQRFGSEGRQNGRFGVEKRLKDVNSNHIPLGSKPKLKTMDSGSQNFEFRNTESKSTELRNAEFRNPESRNRSNSKAEAKSNPSIHPSWQAKQKEKLVIASSLSIPVKAKHIKFDD